MFLNRCIPFCCNSCPFAAVYALKPPFYNTCADLKGGGGFRKGGGGGGGEVPRLPPPPPPHHHSMNPCISLYVPFHFFFLQCCSYRTRRGNSRSQSGQGFIEGGGGCPGISPPLTKVSPPQEILQQQLNNIEENYTTIQCFCSLNISKTSLKFNLR